MNAALNFYAKRHNVDRESLCVMGFDNSAHGNSTATMSVSSTWVNPNNKPTFDWPVA